MSTLYKSKIGKKNTIYLPKKLVESLKVHEGDAIEISEKNGNLIIKFVHDPLSLALEGDKFSEIDPDEAEKIIEEEQNGSEYSF